VPRREGDAVFVSQTTFHPNAVTLATAAPVELESGDDRSGVDVSLRPVRAASLSGILQSANARTSGIQLRLVPAGSADSALFDAAAVQSDAQGRFTFPLVPPGNYTLLGVSVGSANEPAVWLSAPVSVGPEGAKDLAFVLKPDLSVTGHFRFAGTSPVPAPAQLSKLLFGVRSVRPRARANPASDMAPVMSSGDGAFAMSAIVPGRYILRPSGLDAGSPWKVLSIQVNGREFNDLPLDLTADLTDVEVIFTDQPAAVTGRVTSVDPLENAIAVMLFPADRSLWPDARAMTRRFRLARASAAGDFLFADVPPGDYLAVAAPDLGTVAWPDVTLLTKLQAAATPVRVEAGQRPSLVLTAKEIR
jgi:hypothetical protein